MTTPAPKHPAKYSEPIVDRLRVLVQAEKRRVLGRTHDGPLTVLDPFAGVGRIHRLAYGGPGPGRIQTVGIECEAEWAACHEQTVHADAFAWLRAYNRTNAVLNSVAMDRPPVGFDIVATSPTYGNRFADHHNARDGSRRRSYTHDLGHELHPNNSGQFHWGPRYWAFHTEAWRLVYGALRPGGLFLLNVSDFYRQRKLVHAIEWHRGAAMAAGFLSAGSDALIATSRLLGVGAEATSARATHEVVLKLRKPEFPPFHVEHPSPAAQAVAVAVPAR